MSKQHQDNLDTTQLSQKDKKIQELEQQLAQSQQLLEQQQQQHEQYNKQIKEKMILQEQLSKQLSSFHLKTHVEHKENYLHSTKKIDELNKAQEHLIFLGHILLKNKKTIQRLKRYKLKDDLYNQTINDLLAEKNSLWDIILQVHQYIPHNKCIEAVSKEDKAKEILTFLNTKKKIKP